MKTFWTETKAIEAYLQEKHSGPERLLFEAKLLIDPALREKLALQAETYKIIKNYSRKKLKAELQDIQHKLFATDEHKGFRKIIMDLFC